jgi:hypothetical protein
MDLGFDRNLRKQVPKLRAVVSIPNRELALVELTRRRLPSCNPLATYSLKEFFSAWYLRKVQS